jgi:hypothetical protein
VSRWWNGEDRPFDIPGVVGLYHEQQWTSRACHSVVNYIKKYQWQIIGTIIAAASLIVAVKKL